MNIDESTLGRIENNHIKVSTERLVKMAEILDVTVNEVFEGLLNSNCYITNNHIACINNFINAQKEAHEKQNNLIEKLLEQNNQLTEKLVSLIEGFMQKKP